ncbi:hypothetical protein BVX93_02170, partial [bacterium B13(2017)]
KESIYLAEGKIALFAHGKRYLHFKEMITGTFIKWIDSQIAKVKINDEIYSAYIEENRKDYLFKDLIYGANIMLCENKRNYYETIYDILAVEVINSMADKKIKIQNSEFHTSINLPNFEGLGLEEQMKEAQKYIAKAKEKGAKSIGLVRSEIIFENMDQESLTLDNEKEYYKTLIESVGEDSYATIRTFDADNDKPVLKIAPKGHSGIDFTLSTKAGLEIFTQQIQALIQAACEAKSGKLKIMFPKVNNLEEISKAFIIFKDQKDNYLNSLTDKELRKKHEEKIDSIELGTMIETQSAVDNLLEFQDFSLEGLTLSFFSIGTNDLNQAILSKFLRKYLEKREKGYQKLHRTISEDDKTAEKYSTEDNFYCGNILQLPTLMTFIEIMNKTYNSSFPVSLCGDYAGNPKFIAFLAVMDKLKYLPDNFWKQFIPSFIPGNYENDFIHLTTNRFFFQNTNILPQNSVEDIKKILKDFNFFDEVLPGPDEVSVLHKAAYDDLSKQLDQKLSEIVDYWTNLLLEFVDQLEAEQTLQLPQKNLRTAA